MKRTILLAVACVAVMFTVVDLQAGPISISNNFRISYRPDGRGGKLAGASATEGWKVSGTSHDPIPGTGSYIPDGFRNNSPSHVYDSWYYQYYITATDGREGHSDYSRFIASEQYHGDLSKLDGGDLSFNLAVLNKSATRSGLGRVVIEGGGQSVNADFITIDPPQGDWNGYSKEFSATTFGTDQTTWSTILADVTNIELWADYAQSTGETAGLEYFRIYNNYTPPEVTEPEVTATPEPTSLAIFGIGALCMGAGAARRRRKQQQAGV